MYVLFCIVLDDDEVDVLMGMLSKRQGTQGFEKNVIQSIIHTFTF